MLTSKGRGPWLLVLTLHEAFSTQVWRTGSLPRDPWTWEKAVSRWARREDHNLLGLLRVPASCAGPRLPQLQPQEALGVPHATSLLQSEVVELPLPSAPLTWQWAHVSDDRLKLQVKQVPPVTVSVPTLAYLVNIECGGNIDPGLVLITWLISWNQQGLQSQNIMDSFFRTPIERSPGSWIPCHLHLVLQWHSRPFRGWQAGNQVFGFLKTSPTWNLFTHSAAPGNVALFLGNCFILFTP